jgi:hypothetical protein
VRLLTRNGTRRPLSEYVRAKQEMERLLELEAEAGAAAAAASDEKVSKFPTTSLPPPVSVAVFEVAAWGRDSIPLANALLRSRVSLVVAGGGNKLQPLEEKDLAARVIRELSSSCSSSSSSSSPFSIVSVGGPRVLTWRELVTQAGASVGVEPLFVSVPRWFLEKVLLPAAELVSSRSSSGSSSKLSRAGYLARLAADVMATDLVAEEAVVGREQARL